MDFAAKFEEGLRYEPFLNKYASEEHRRRWDAVYAETSLTDAQKELLRSFRREMKVLVNAGAWCGDCINQCPIFARFEAENEQLDIRYFDRDDHPDLTDALMICGGKRVPSVLFLSEDGYACGWYGDRTLSKYREMAQSQLGAACPTGISTPGETLLQKVTQEWLDEFERIELLLRTSNRLRQTHGD